MILGDFGWIWVDFVLTSNLAPTFYPRFLFYKKGLDRLNPEDWPKNNKVEGGCKSGGARFEVESYEKRVHAYMFHSRKRVHPYLFRLKKTVQAYLFLPGKWCRPTWTPPITYRYLGVKVLGSLCIVRSTTDFYNYLQNQQRFEGIFNATVMCKLLK